MQTPRLALTLTLVNLALLVGIALSQARAANATQDVVPMLRGRGFEIVDAQGRVRASISIQPPVRVDGKDYTETVLLRLINSRGGPIVKIGASENGSGLNLSDGSRNFSGVQLLAHDTGSVVALRDGKGAAHFIKP